MNEGKKTIFSPNKIVAIIIYLIVLFLVAGFITIFIGTSLGIIKGLDNELIIKSFIETDLSGYEIEYVKVNAIAQGWGNFLGYLISFVAVVFFMRDDVVTDFKGLLEKKKFYSIYCLIGLVYSKQVES